MYTTCIRAPLLALVAASILGAQSTPIPGKFYEYYVVANTADGQFQALGVPAINDYGLCAFMGQTSIGQTIWTGDGDNHALVDINPGSGNPGGLTFDPQMQINTANQVVARDVINGNSSNVRLWNANATDSYTYLGRAGAGQKYNALYPGPSVNKSNASVFAAITTSGTEELVEDVAGKFPTFGVNTGTPQPVIATNGNMVITTTNRSTGLNEITVFSNGFTAQTDIADGTNFSYLDTAPGISEDGNVVVFEGTLTAAGANTLTTSPGPGIFAATYNGTAWQITRITGLMIASASAGGNNTGFCQPGQTCVNAAELGYNDAGQAVYFTSYPTNSRVAVSNLTLGAAGIANDSFVIAFMGTPSSASRTNPMLPNTPLLFSNQTGLWTIRVDVENELSPPNSMVFHPFTAIPVAQINDQIGPGNIVESIDVNMQIANAAEDETGAIRTMRRGDHRIAFLATTASGDQIIYRANHLDSDQDGLLDNWETTGIDMNQDGIVDLNLAQMGANPNQRDLFLQIDWLADQTGYNFRPAPGVVIAPTGAPGALPAMLATSPALSGAMYGYRSDGAAPETIPAGITMHIDGGGSIRDANDAPLSYNMGLGPLAGGNQIGLNGPGDTTLIEVLYFGMPNSINLAGVTSKSFQDVKDQYFGSWDKDGRELAFKYAIVADHNGFIEPKPANHNITGVGTTSGQQYIVSADPIPNLPSLTPGQFIKITAGTGVGQYTRIAQLLPASNQIVLSTPFPTAPDTTSTFAYIGAYSGNSELFISAAPDYNSLPGNDFMVTFGNWGINPNGGYLMNTCAQWRTFAHEMGHTMGLRHGGIDNTPYSGDSYLSLMNYTYQLACKVESPVQAYSTTGDPTFDDFANLNHQFSSVFFHVGSSSGMNYGTGDWSGQTPEQNPQDYINENGPIDLTPPTVAITAPAANSQIALGSPLIVTINAADSASIALVQATFDANGDGSIESNEIATAKAAGNNVYHAEFATISGSAGSRVLTAFATDPSGNLAKASITLKVITPNPAPVLKTLTPSSATHGGASFNITVAGTGFLSGCTGYWNSTAVKTTFISSTQLKLGIPSTDIAAAGTAQITVVNPAEGTNKSNALTFTIN